MLKHMLFGGVVETAKPWVATLGDSNDNYSRSIAVAPDGSVYVCGNTESTSNGSNDLLLAKFSSSGTVQWQKTLGGGGDERGQSVAVAPDGSVYVCGITRPYLLIAKFNSSGTVQWQKTLGGGPGNSIAVAPDGSIYVCVQGGSSYYVSTLSKFSSSGTTQWGKTLYGDSRHNYGLSVAVAPDGSVYVCGYTDSVYNGTHNFLLTKFSSSGTAQWYKTLGAGYERGQSVAVAPDGSVYVCGYTDSVGAGGTYFLLAKFSSSGTVQWQKTLGGSGNDYCESVAVAPDGSVYVCGNTTSAGAGGADLLLAKFSSSGTVQWQKTLGGSKLDEGQSVAVAPDGSVYVCGNTTSAGDGTCNLLIAKITNSIIEKDTVTFGSLTFQDASFTSENVSLGTASYSGASIDDSYLGEGTSSSLTVGTSSLTTNLYTYEE